ncbi:hypothetical protein KMW28_26125 [Flammeovirga yaeyamensis]|uniref:Uncharacterized protein n=1 Tax=Flammeovirga yaeyamensis TaxID=367791 RepID=A0AAX1NAA0_9BACT|nr:hypothetical protein [Flammeovirga yaeyamensis]MBB3699221.1 hypothetical protein [Flammeovirga yaeyamensis]NMF35516.1 hypothetical protein [Flammeovirga yaeyamensis]QWG04375.1 hypothetical protein KMW28_26125 [Flammeovirga yaeyamensis]
MKTIVQFFILFFLSFNLLAQEKNYIIPEGYEEYISQKDYKFLVDKSVKIISKNFKVEKVKEGTIYLEDGQAYSLVNLHNLIMKCHQMDKKEWTPLLKAHFQSMTTSIDEHKNNDFTDFVTAKKYLSIRIYPKEFVQSNGGVETLITREDLEGTYSVIMLDLPSSFSPLMKSDTENWNISKEEIFKYAQENVNKQEILKETHPIEVNNSTINVSFIGNEDYAASIALDLEKNAPEFVGEWGCVLAIPNKGIASLCKISKDNPVDFVLYIQKFNLITDQFYNEHPQPVSKDFYWYYKGKFQKIQLVIEDNTIQVINPLGLTKLMGEM